MTTTPDASAAEVEVEVEEHPFESKLDPRWALSLWQVLAVGLFGLLFLWLNLLPLRATDLWGHVAYGHWMLEHQRLPTEDPVMPLAQGMQVVDTAWLSQLLLGAVDRYLGPEVLSHLFAVTSLLTYLLWSRVFYLQTQRVGLSILATLLVLLVGWSRLTTLRPETFAALCCAAIFWLIARQQLAAGDYALTSTSDARPRTWLMWLGVPLVLALWANLHGSYVVGLLVLACWFAGRVVEVLWKQRSLRAVALDGECRRWLLLLELGLLATLINPYGIDLWIHTARFSSNPNLKSVLEWQPLVILGVGGRQFAISILVLIAVWRHSRRPIRPTEVLLLLLFAALTISSIRMIGWYAPVLAFVLAPHLAEIAQRLWPVRSHTAAAEADEGEAAATSTKLPAPGHSFRYSLVALLLVWIAFALSPISGVLFPQRPARKPEQLYGSTTPVALTRYLKKPPKESPLARKSQWNSPVFGPQWWGDWLDRAGPRELQPFVTTNIHLVPRQVWTDYQRVMGVQSGWERTLDRYRVETIVIDKREQPQLLSALKSHSDWQNVYDDEQAAVFVLRETRSRESQNAETTAPEAV